MSKKIARAVVLIFLISIIYCGAAIAQGFNRAVIEQIDAKLPFISAYINIIDDRDSILAIKSLSIDSISATMDDEELDVISFKSYKDADIGTTYFLMIDLSDSADRNFIEIKKAIINWVDNKKEEDRIVLLTFGEEVKVLLDGDESNTEILNVIDNIKSGDKETKFFDCIYKAINMAQSLDNTFPARKIFITVTDGEDYSDGGVVYDEIITRLVDSNIPLYNVAVSASTSNEVSKLGELSRSTNAKVLRLKGNDISSVFETLQKELSSGYVVLLKSKNNIITNEERTIKIAIDIDSSKLFVSEDINITDYHKDTVLPDIEKIDVINHKNIVLTYSEEVKGAGNICNYSISSKTGESLAIISSSYDFLRAKIILDEPIYNGEYILTAINIHDDSMERNTLEQSEYSFKVDEFSDIDKTSDINTISTARDTTNQILILGLNKLTFILIVAVLFILIVVIVIVTIFRKKNTANENIDTVKTDNAPLHSEVKLLKETVMGFAKGAAKGIKRLNEKIENYSSLIDNQQEELTKYKEGYKYSINKSTVGRTIRLIEEIDDMEQDENILFVKKQLLYSLESNGVYCFRPNLYEKFDKSMHKCVNTIPTEQVQNDKRISRVLKLGYKIEITEAEYRILVPAEVEIFELKKN